MSNPTVLSALDGLLKRNYGDEFITQQQTDDDFIMTLPKAKDQPQGEDAAFRPGIRIQRRQNVGAQNQNESFRTNRSGVRKQFTINAKINVAAIEVTGFLIALAKNPDAAFISGLDDEMEDAHAMLKKDENRQAFGDGKGVLALVNGALVASTALVVDTPGVQYFFPGERIDIYTAGGVAEALDVEITAIDESTNTLTTGTAITVSNDSKIYRQGVKANEPSDGKEMMGLAGIADDGSNVSTFQGLSRTSYDILKGSLVDANGAQITSDLLQRAIDKGERRSGRVVDTMISHRNQRRQYLNLVTPLKRFNGADAKLDAGFRKGSLDWNGIEWRVSHDCQRNRVYAWKEGMIKRYETYAMKLDDTEGSTIHRIGGTDTFESYYKHYATIGSTHPASVVCLDDLAIASDA